MQKLVEIVAGVTSGSTTATAVVEEHLARIKVREAEIHAFNLVTADQARKDAAKIDEDVKAGKAVGALAGVPIALKDNMCTRGVQALKIQHLARRKILLMFRAYPVDQVAVARLQLALVSLPHLWAVTRAAAFVNQRRCAVWSASSQLMARFRVTD